MHRILIVLVALAMLTACGGNSSQAPAINPSSTPPSSTGGAPAPVHDPVIVNVAAGGNAAGVDITVGPPAGTSPPNAQALGVAGSTGSASAFNTGTTISRSAPSGSQRVVLFGPGLSGNMTVIVRGPNDIQALSPTSITAKDGTPGISFTAVVSSTAALGARTVVLQAANGDITTFTGGLEVVP